VLVPRIGRRGGGGGREVSIGRGSRQTVYVLGPDGNPSPVRVVVGESNGSETEIVGGDLREGQEVITARLAAGQTQDKSERPRRGRDRRGGGDRGDRGEQPQGNGQQAAPARPPAAAPAAPLPAAAGERPARGPSPAPTAAEGQPPARGEGGRRPGGGMRGPGGQRIRDMTPEQRRAFFESLTPEQRQQMRERRRQWRERREAEEGAAPDG
jgi:HlyD family secretion protein